MLNANALLPLACLALCLVARPAAAEPGFADPPGAPEFRDPAPQPRDQPPSEDAPPIPDDSVPTSNVRVSIGPGLRVADSATDGGLAAALDLGAGAVGARAQGTWVRVGSDQGLSQYGADLWIDFGTGRRLHPILGAGAALARLSQPSADGSRDTASYGVGVLRGTLEYLLPVENADARAGIDAVGCVPAIQGRHAPDASPWLLITARVGIGF